MDSAAEQAWKYAGDLNSVAHTSSLLKDWKAATATYRYTPVFSCRRSETNKP